MDYVSTEIKTDKGTLLVEKYHESDHYRICISSLDKNGNKNGVSGYYYCADHKSCINGNSCLDRVKVYKAGHWDGMIYFFSKQTGILTSVYDIRHDEPITDGRLKDYKKSADDYYHQAKELQSAVCCSAVQQKNCY